MTNSKLNIRQITICALMIAALILCTQISFNLPGGIPITMQTFAIALIGFLLGLELGTFIIVVYLIFGLIGLPVFSNFGSGPAKLAGPTGGYLIGFIPMVVLIGLAGNLIKKKQIIRHIFVGCFSISGRSILLSFIWNHLVGSQN